MRYWGIFLLLMFLMVTSASAAEKGLVIANVNDETFVIQTIWGKQLFKAKTYCFQVNRGDTVLFVDSTGVCVSNTFIDLNTDEKCEVWCE